MQNKRKRNFLEEMLFAEYKLNDDEIFTETAALKLLYNEEIKERLGRYTETTDAYANHILAAKATDPNRLNEIRWIWLRLCVTNERWTIEEKKKIFDIMRKIDVTESALVFFEEYYDTEYKLTRPK